LATHGLLLVTHVVHRLTVVVVIMVVVLILLLITATAAARVGFTRRVAVVALDLSLLALLVLLGLVDVSDMLLSGDVLEAAASVHVADGGDHGAWATVGEEETNYQAAGEAARAASGGDLALAGVVVAGVALLLVLAVVAIFVVLVAARIALVRVRAATSLVIVAHSWLQVGVARGAGTASAARSTAAVGVTAALQVGALRRGVGQGFNLIVLGVSALVVLPGVVGEVHAAQL
jgi:hypothetical protein